MNGDGDTGYLYEVTLRVMVEVTQRPKTKGLRGVLTENVADLLSRRTDFSGSVDGFELIEARGLGAGGVHKHKPYKVGKT